jgi:hypothetical protein
MVQMAARTILPLDIVEYSEDTLYSLSVRTAKNGVKSMLDTKIPVKVGVVIELFGVKYVTDIHSKGFLVPFNAIIPRVTAVYRDNILADSSSAYPILAGIMQIHSILASNGKVELIKLAKKMSKGYDSAMFITLLMINCIKINGDIIGNTATLKGFIENFGNYHKL